MTWVASIVNLVAALVVLWLLDVTGHMVDWQQWLAIGGWGIFATWTHRIMDRK